MKINKLNLRLFDGEGGAAATSEGASGEGEQIKYESTRHTNKGEDIKYGVQEEVPNTQEASDIKVTSDTLEDKRKAYNDMIKGEYKDFYTEDTQRLINKRFKETETLRTQVNEAQPLIDMLMAKYGSSDIKGVMEALEADDNYWQDQADEAGMTIEQFKQFQKMKAENEQFKRLQEERRVENSFKQKAEAWFPEIENIKGMYPDFDLNGELQNQKFVNLLDKLTDAQFPNPLKTAYELFHKDEIDQAKLKAQEKAVVDNIRARGSRPSENGTSSQSAFIVKDDVSKLSKADRAEIARRAARGEVIKF